MLIINSDRFLRLLAQMHQLGGVLTGLTGDGTSVKLVVDSTIRSDMDEIMVLLNDLSLPMSLKEADRLKAFFSSDKIDGKSGAEKLHSLMNRIQDEVSLRTLFMLSDRETKLFSDLEPFGPEVGSKFPDCQFDLEEASKCLALNRGTASVIHLGRAVEIALHRLASKIGAKFKAIDQWDTILQEMEKVTNSWGYQTDAEIEKKDQYRRIHAQLTSVKRAWRHPSAHARFTATPEIAIDIFEAVKGFMRQMAEVM